LEELLAAAWRVAAPSCRRVEDRQVEVPEAAGLLESQPGHKATVRTALVHQESPQQMRMGWVEAGGWLQEAVSTRLAVGQPAELPEPARTDSLLPVHPAARYMEMPFAPP
jgi:hypothetical protein